MVALNALSTGKFRVLLLNREFHFWNEFRDHLAAQRVIEPVEEPTNGTRFAEALIGIEADFRKELLDLPDRFESVALPATEAQGARGFHRPVPHAHQRRRGGGAALRQSGVVATESITKRFQAAER